MEQRKTEIIIQTRERIFARQSYEVRAYCPRCETITAFITPENGACVTATNVRSIFRSVESGAIHFIETAGGLMFICRPSLEKQWPVSKTI